MKKRKTLTKDFEQLVENNDTEAIKKVFEKCDINAYGGYFKGNALSFRLSEELMTWLVENGADVNYVDAYGYTALLHHAGSAWTEEQALTLVKLGADVHATTDLYKTNALHYAVEAGNLNLVQRLLELGTDISAPDWNGDTPLERAFLIARGEYDFIRLEPVTKYLLSKGIPVTEKLQKYMKETAIEIEFRRNDFPEDDPFTQEEADSALNSLYELLHVTPVPRRKAYDGKTRIEVKEKTWQKQHEELWNLLVPGSGHTNTVQGEVIRISGKLSHEILDNGACNWDQAFKEIAQALLAYTQMGNPLPETEAAEVKQIIRSIKNAWEEELYRLSELSVKWVLLNPDPIALEDVSYYR